MKRASIVIGSLWGDEGKGHMTDILCNTPNTLNVRFNGGSQASHTVVTPDGKRHAFRHFGAGTFAGAHTYLSEHFIVNTISFSLERAELIEKFGLFPTLFVNPNCLVTTLWDIYINQCIETLRGENRHGSCGFGINETVQRSIYSKYKITVMDLLFKDKLKSKLYAIQDEYVPMRLKTEYNLKIEDLPDEHKNLLTNPENINLFLFYAEEFLKYVNIHRNSILNKFDNVVFEGAQGLLLDQNNSDYFPHVTTSNTGIKNVMDILKDLNFNDLIDIYYMSRCYITKHGAGPFKSEVKEKPYSNIVDLTNIPNQFQGALRFGYLDFDLLAFEINKDLKNLLFPATVNITFTCLDQLDDNFKYFEDGKLRSKPSNDFLEIAQRILCSKISKLHNIYATSGLTRYDFISEKRVAYV